MPRSPARRAGRGDMAELQSAVVALSEQVRVLTLAVDALTDEVEWRNNALRDEPALPPFLVRSMPLDPAADDWRLNQHPSLAGAKAPDPPAPVRVRAKTLFD